MQHHEADNDTELDGNNIFIINQRQNYLRCLLQLQWVQPAPNFGLDCVVRAPSASDQKETRNATKSKQEMHNMCFNRRSLW